METLEAIKKRYSCREFTEDKVTKAELDTLLRAGMCAPSALNNKPWVFYIATGERIRERIKMQLRGGKYDAPLIILIALDERKAVKDSPEMSYIDLAAAAQNILLAATDLGLGSVYTAIYPKKGQMQGIQEACKLDDYIKPFCAIFIGHPVKAGRAKNKYDETRIIRL